MESTNIENSISLARNLEIMLLSEAPDPNRVSEEARRISRYLDMEYLEKGWGSARGLMHDTMNKLNRLTNSHILLEERERFLPQLRKDSLDLIGVLEGYLQCSAA